eukprot:m.834753 g.834753  ORF g.834753 m.834753 type:complete len:654 (+) comp59469_c0_seq37:24-1985(+)
MDDFDDFEVIDAADVPAHSAVAVPSKPKGFKGFLSRPKSPIVNISPIPTPVARPIPTPSGATPPTSASTALAPQATSGTANGFPQERAERSVPSSETTTSAAAAIGLALKSAKYSNTAELDDSLEFVEVTFEDVQTLDRVQKQSIFKKGHFKKTTPSQAKCLECNKEFGILRKPGNCRRCGQLFCGHCLKNLRKLNSDGFPDPLNGSPANVCGKCYGERVEAQTIGPMRSHTDLFRVLSKRAVLTQVRTIIDKCSALRAGYERQSALLRALDFAAVPSWAKVNFVAGWEESVKCVTCESTFSFLNRRTACRLCGRAFCATCVFHSIMLYMEQGRSCIDVLSPGNHPKGFVTQPGCDPCLVEMKKAIERIRRPQATSTLEGSKRRVGEESVVLAGIAGVYEDAMECRRIVAAALPQYKAIVWGFGVTQDPQAQPQKTDPKHIVARLDSNLVEAFRLLGVSLAKMQARSADARTNTEKQVLPHIIRGQTCYYRECLWEFRELQQQLHAILTPQALEDLLNEVNMKALRNAFTILKQLAVEACEYPQCDTIIAALTVLLDELELTLSIQTEAAGVSWRQASKDIKACIAENFKVMKLFPKFDASKDDSKIKASKKLRKLCDTIASELENSGSLKAVMPVIRMMRKLDFQMVSSTPH